MQIANMFFVGQIYNRRKDIHEKYGGQSQGGISTPKGFPLIFIFTGETGKKYGYHDTFRDDGVFLLTGEGMKGDMSLVRGNLAIATHNETGKTLRLFQILKRGMVQYMGQAQCLNYHYEKRPDIENKITWKDFTKEQDIAKYDNFHKTRIKSPEKAPRTYEIEFIPNLA